MKKLMDKTVICLMCALSILCCMEGAQRFCGLPQHARLLSGWYANADEGVTIDTILAYLKTASISDLFEMSQSIDDELRRRGFPSGSDPEGDVLAHDFPDAIVDVGILSRVDCVVAFGDSIFSGYNAEDNRGIVQQLAEKANLPLICLAEPNATLTTRRTSVKSVVLQVMDYVPEPGTTPLIVIGGSTNDQFEYNLTNLGEFGSDDPDTIYGATKFILDNLIGKGIEPWQIVLTTPIPKGIRGDEEYRRRIDAQLRMVGYAVYQVGLSVGCNVINGYHSVFQTPDSESLKITLMTDDTHPSALGASYCAAYIVKALS